MKVWYVKLQAEIKKNTKQIILKFKSKTQICSFYQDFEWIKKKIKRFTLKKILENKICITVKKKKITSINIQCQS